MDKHRTCMISQPRYLPALQYLERIKKADVFIIYDTVQRVSRGFENRNRLKDGKWLTIPISSSSREIIRNTKIADLNWIQDHKNKIASLYGQVTPVVNGYYDCFDNLSYADTLAHGIKYLLKHLNVDTQVMFASELDSTANGGVSQLMNLCQLVNCGTYISGGSCLGYGLTHEVAQSYGIDLVIDKFQGDAYGFPHYF